MAPPNSSSVSKGRGASSPRPWSHRYRSLCLPRGSVGKVCVLLTPFEGLEADGTVCCLLSVPGLLSES